MPSSAAPRREELSRLIRDENLAALQSFLKKFPKLLDIKSTNRTNYSLLNEAASFNRVQIVEWLLNHKPELADEADYYGRNALYCAAFYGHIETVKFLLALRPDLIGTTDKYGRTALVAATINSSNEDVKKVEVIKFLLEFKPKLINIVNNNGETALYKPYSFNIKNIISILQNKLTVDQVLNEASKFKDMPYLQDYKKLIIQHCTPLYDLLEINPIRIICQYIIDQDYKDQNTKIIFDSKLQSLVLLTTYLESFKITQSETQSLKNLDEFQEKEAFEHKGDYLEDDHLLSVNKLCLSLPKASSYSYEESSDILGDIENLDPPPYNINE